MTRHFEELFVAICVFFSFLFIAVAEDVEQLQYLKLRKADQHHALTPTSINPMPGSSPTLLTVAIPTNNIPGGPRALKLRAKNEDNNDSDGHHSHANDHSGKKTKACKRKTQTQEKTKTDDSPPPTDPPKTIDCRVIEPDPDEGIDSAACVCEGSTWPALTVQGRPSDSCAYTTTPANPTNPNAHVQHQTMTYRATCEECVHKGPPGLAPSDMKCHKIPNCTPRSNTKVMISNNTVPIGDWDDRIRGHGTPLKRRLYDQLADEKGPCAGDNACNSKDRLQFSSVEGLVDDEPTEYTISVTVQDSKYSDRYTLKTMLVAGIGAWHRQVAHHCKKIDYEYPMQGYSCPDKPVKRNWITNSTATLEERAPIEESPPPQEYCKSTARICSAPNHIHVDHREVGQGPYSAWLDIQINSKIDNPEGLDPAVCGILEGFGYAATTIEAIWGPEALPETIVGDEELTALCEGAEETSSD